MSCRRRPDLFPLALLLGLVATASAARAQTASVYATDAGNGKIYRVDFGQPSPITVINSASDALAREKLQGILVREDLDGTHLVVCDTEAGQVLFYDTANPGFELGQLITSAIHRPEGIAAASNGDVYLLNKRKASTGLGPEVWRLPHGGSGFGGYGPAELVDQKVPGDEIEDTRVAPLTVGGGAIQAGDLLVLSEKPARVWLYPQAASCPDPAACNACSNRATDCDPGERLLLINETSFPLGVKPNGLAFAPDGTLLIGAEPGRILRYHFTAPGSPVQDTDFFTGSQLDDKIKIAVGPQGGQNRAFVTSQERPSVLRFKIEANGTGTLLDEVRTSDVDDPTGVSLTSAGAAYTQAGANQTVKPSGVTEVKFESVTGGGLTNARLIVFPDPAPHAGDRNLSDVPGLLEKLGITMADDRVIPSYIQAYDRDNGSGPEPTFLLEVVDTTASFTLTLQHHVLEQDLGFKKPGSDDPPSGSDVFDLQPRTFYGTDPDDPVIVELGQFIDISTGYASNIGRGGRTSYVITAFDTRSPVDIAKFKLEKLKAALDPSTPASAGGLSTFVTKSKTLKKLRSEIKGALHELNEGEISDTLAEIQEFIDKVNNNPTHFNNGPRNVAGELLARGESAYFMTCGATPACNRCLGTCP